MSLKDKILEITNGQKLASVMSTIAEESDQIFEDQILQQRQDRSPATQPGEMRA